MGGWVGWSKEIVSPQSGSAEHSLESKFRLSVAKKCSLLYILIACFGSVGLPLIVGGWGGDDFQIVGNVRWHTICH